MGKIWNGHVIWDMQPNIGYEMGDGHSTMKFGTLRLAILIPNRPSVKKGKHINIIE
jgi:hypothetical protein